MQWISHGKPGTMNQTNLRILQLNIMKSRAGMEALINDPATQDLDILLIQEPPITAYRTHVNHRLWYRYQPTYRADNVRMRSLIYVNKRISTSAHRQIPCNHPDVTAIKIWNGKRQTLVFSVYVKPIDLHHIYDLQSMQPTLDEIEATIRHHTQNSPLPTTLIAAGDFNRHHPAWSSTYVYERVMAHAEELINFIHLWGLSWSLPSGTPTFWSLSRPGQKSTIDLTLTDTPMSLVKCELYKDNFGSDHRATYSEWDMRVQQRSERPPRRAYERADWAKIGSMIQRQMAGMPQLETKEQLDDAAKSLIAITTAAVDKHTPHAKPCPYSKRWFTPELKLQQREVNKLRRQWQNSCATEGPYHPRTQALFSEMRIKRRAWTRTVEKVKAAHWKDFLDQANSRTVWHATPYLERQDDYANIPPLKVGDHEFTDNQDKARVLMETFFPSTEPPPPENIVPPREIPWDPITEMEITKALKAAKKRTAPGEDGLPTLVWSHLWPYVSSTVTRIFTASIDLGHYPQQWKAAKIVVLRKPGKSDYTSPSAFRPISLLNTLGKLLEALIARRLSYYAETHRLLPDTQFGGRPGRNTEQALLVLANSIDQAWLRSKVVTLVAFDLKGAFNGVNGSALNARLLEKGIPTPIRGWVQSFMQDRTASIQFDGFATVTTPLLYAGLAQGSPLSPILFALFNSDLVDQAVDTQGGASAYIDDYFRWRVGTSAEENLQRLQQEDIPRIAEWARRTGSSFAVEKTELIHLTRRKKELGKGSIDMDGKNIKTGPTAKLLGVVFDQEMRWKDHVQQAVKKATTTTLGMSGLRHLRPAQMRQIYQACVLPKLDYASTVWHNPRKDKGHLRVFGTVQRAALLRIISAFRSVATQSLEVECHILPTHLRLKQRGQDVVSRLCTLPQEHPLAKVMDRVKRRVKRQGTQHRFPLAETMKTMEIRELETLETIEPTPLEPWRQPTFDRITIEQDKVQALDQVAEIMRTSDSVIYTDASAKDSNLGAAVVMPGQSNERQRTWQIGIGPGCNWTVHAAELIAIYQATEIIDKEIVDETREGTEQEKILTIVSDSQSAIRAIANPSGKSGQGIVRRILDRVKALRERRIKVRLYWIPSHSGNPGNETADQLAKQAVTCEEHHDFRRLVSTHRRTTHKKIQEEWQREWTTTQKGKHLKQIDDGPPTKRSLRVYGTLTRHQTYLLAQLRTGHSWLATHARRWSFTDDDRCVCGAIETVVHVLVDCPRLREARQQLRTTVGDAFNSIATMLGGRPHNEQGKASNGGINRDVLNAVLEFAEASQRFKSRAPAARPREQHRPQRG
jgi:ribonuclease HI